MSTAKVLLHPTSSRKILPAHEVFKVVYVFQALVSEINPVKVRPSNLSQAWLKTCPHSVNVRCEQPFQVRDDCMHCLLGKGEEGNQG